MLSFVRKHSQSWLIKFILWAVIIAFGAGTFFLGTGGSTGSSGSVVAVVNGKEIFLKEYDRAYRNLIEIYRQQFRGQFSEQLIERLDLKNSALDQLILARILETIAEEQEIKVSDDELSHRIKTLPVFQQDNKFNSRAYQNYLNFNRTTAKQFEQDIRDNIQREKVQNLITENTQVSHNEVMEMYRRENEKVKFSYITFPKDHFEEPSEPSEEEVKAFFKKQVKDFMIPEQINVQYVRLTPKMLEDSITIRDEDVADFYESNKGKFHVKKNYKARHILYRTNQSTETGDEAKKKNKEAEEEAKKKAENLLKKIKEGADFAEMAKEHSDDKASGTNGGDLGQFSKGTMVPEFEAALDNMKAGEVGGPVKTTFGYHLIKLEEVNEARVKPLDEVKDQVIKDLKLRKGKLRIQRALKKMRVAAEEKNDLAAAASAAGYEVGTTGLISRKKHTVPQIGIVPDFFNLAFTLRDNELSELLNTPEASFLLKVIERQAPKEPKLEDVREEVVEKLMAKKTKDATKARFKELAAQLKKSKDLEKVAKELELEVQETPFFSLTDSIPGIGNIQPIKDKAFATKKGNATSGESNFAYYLILVNDFEKAGSPDDKDLRAIYDRLKTVRGDQLFKDWLKKIREKADIKINREMMEVV
ncbi:MAG: hypothetical protein G3M70_00755 [Candidatus Nitronauta litoralis]|uniref:Periplasmic chaperone PpiD n=1 Tax=Candidatus Nitronauta litoralis TaxID=2705533 RepID=A0A7T0FYW4_9BACT|nr:MAG: hypothetical protein G3M70_00755 [Candidatus Nitronauta litoralis]